MRGNIIYLAVNIAIFNTMTVSEIMLSEKVGVDASVILFGTTGASVIAIGILISIVGCLSGFLMTAAQVPYAMAVDGMFPGGKYITRLSKRGMPRNALFIEVTMAAIYALSGSFDILTNMAEFVMWMFYILGIAGVFIIRRKHKELMHEGQYKVPFYPVVPLIGIAGSVYVCISTLISGTGYAVLGLIIAALGLPVFIILRKSKKEELS